MSGLSQLDPGFGQSVRRHGPNIYANYFKEPAKAETYYQAALQAASIE